MTTRAPILTNAVQVATIVRDFEASGGAATSGEARERSSSEKRGPACAHPHEGSALFERGYWPTRLMPSDSHDVSTVHAHVA
jgi:hypothetical protein